MLPSREQDWVFAGSISNASCSFVLPGKNAKSEKLLGLIHDVRGFDFP